jgi:hypothetical protein
MSASLISFSKSFKSLECSYLRTMLQIVASLMLIPKNDRSKRAILLNGSWRTSLRIIISAWSSKPYWILAFTVSGNSQETFSLVSTFSYSSLMYSIMSLSHFMSSSFRDSVLILRQAGSFSNSSRLGLR